MVSVLWKTSSLNINIASIRYRCLLPHKYLNITGEKSELFWSKPEIKWAEYNFLMLVKTFSQLDIDLAKKAKEAGVKVGFDLCDNIFYDYPETHDGKKRNESAVSSRNMLAKITPYCDFFVVPTEALKSELSKHINLPIYTVPDGIETPEDTTDFEPRLRFCQKIKKLKNHISNFLTLARLRLRQIVHNEKFILWFGNSGFPGVFGVTDLAIVKEDLNRVLNKENGTLLVCTDSRKMFDENISPDIARAQFVSWNSEVVPSLMKLSHGTILPSLQNAFTQGKSNNRPLLSLYYSTPVVMTNTPSISPLKSLVKVEDWAANLTSILSGEKKVLTEPQRLALLKQYGGAAIAGMWKDTLNQAQLNKAGK